MDNLKMVKTMDIKDLLIKLEAMNNVNIKMVILLGIFEILHQAL